MDLLARREYSRYEVEERLMARFPTSAQFQDVLVEVLDKLVKDDLLSDQRFSESLVRDRISKGQGPVRISLELQKRGVSRELAFHAIQSSGTDWHELAVKVAAKKYGNKYGNKGEVDITEKAKRSRFLQYRGFEAGQISHALNQKS
jgi:regulatory protein